MTFIVNSLCVYVEAFLFHVVVPQSLLLILTGTLDSHVAIIGVYTSVRFSHRCSGSSHVLCVDNAEGDFLIMNKHF